MDSIEIDRYGKFPVGESDDALRRVYGEKAQFSRVGSFTLVHLDEPSPEEILRRETEFDPDDFFFDDCPLCVAAKAEGGHIVFDGSDDDPLRSTTYEPAGPKGDGPSPAVSFDLALVEVASAAEALGELVREACPEELISRYEAEVAVLHERFVETLWAEESTRRIECFERLLVRALTTLGEIRDLRPHLDDRIVPLEGALTAVATVWRSL
jgi:hypothetical protein